MAEENKEIKTEEITPPANAGQENNEGQIEQSFYGKWPKGSYRLYMHVDAMPYTNLIAALGIPKMSAEDGILYIACPSKEQSESMFEAGGEITQIEEGELSEIVSQLLTTVERVRAKMEADQQEIERLKAETRSLIFKMLAA